MGSSLRSLRSVISTALALLLAACGGGSSTTPPLPTVSLSAAPDIINNGAQATLTWTSTNAATCTASGGWSGTLAVSGSQVIGPLTANTEFALICSDAAGVGSATATVNIVPTATLAASVQVVPPGGSSTLSWNSSNATSCTASGSWSGTLASSGSQSTGPIAANSSYSISCAGAGGTSGIAHATVAVSASAISISPATASLTTSQTIQYAVTVGPAGAALTVDGIAGGNAAVGTVTSSGLYTAGTAPGLHTILATSIADVTQAASATAAVTNLSGVYTYHNDLSRDGANVQEYALTPSNVTRASFGKRASCTVDGAIYAQPLWVANLMVNGARHNVVLIATQHNSVFAFDADALTCVPLWTASLTDAAHGAASGETSIPGNFVGGGSGDIQPEIGITGTPVIDPASNTLYVVAKSTDSTQTTFYQRLHALDVLTGNEKTGSPVLITATYPGTGDGGTTVAFNARQELQRSGLAFVNGVVYIAWSSHEDALPYYGWMMGYQYNGATFTQLAVLNVAPNTQRGGIWMGGGAPSADSNNNLYIVTGNGEFDAGNTAAPNNDYGDSLLKLNASLQVAQYFTPSDQLIDAQDDADFGAGGAAILIDLPAGGAVTHTLMCGGKDTNLFLVNRDALGGFGDAAAVQKIAFDHGIFGTGAFWNTAFYLGGVGGPLSAYQLALPMPQFNFSSSSNHVFGFAGATPSVSAAGAQNGIVWALETGNYCTQQSRGCGPVVLYAYDAANLANALWDSSQLPADAAGYAVKFTVPTIANGKVYVGTRGNNTGGIDASSSIPGELDIYGLRQ